MWPPPSCRSFVLLLPSIILFPPPLPYTRFRYCLILGQYVTCFCPRGSNLAQSFGPLEPSCLQYFAHCRSLLFGLQFFISWFALCCLLLSDMKPSETDGPALQLGFPHHAQPLPEPGLLRELLLSGSFSLVLLSFCRAFCFRWGWVSCLLPLDLFHAYGLLMSDFCSCPLCLYPCLMCAITYVTRRPFLPWASSVTSLLDVVQGFCL